MRIPLWRSLIAAALIALPLSAADHPLAAAEPGEELKLPEATRGATHSSADWEAVQDALAGERRDEPARQRAAELVDQGPGEFAVVHVEFVDRASCEAFAVGGTHVISRFGRFLDLFVPVDDGGQAWNAVAGAPGVRWIDFAFNELRPPPPSLRPEEGRTRQQPAPIVRGGYEGLSGKGVAIAIVDSGVDFRHPDFIEYDDQGQPVSRLLYLWDTDSEAYVFDVGSPAPVSYPNGSPVGTVYSRDDLTAELRRAQPRIAYADSNGHGTACASVAAGNGNASDGAYQGVAPQADLIGVRLGGFGVHDWGIGKSWLIGAICDWLDAELGDRPLVISCSYGGFSGHDGYHVVERQLDERFPLSRTGRAVCFAAGNSGSDPIHAEALLGADGEYAVIEWQGPAYAMIRLFIQAESLDDLDRRYEGSAELQLRGSFVHGLSEHVVVELVSSPGVGRLQLASVSGQPIQVDAYYLGPAGQDAGFFGSTQSFAKMVSSPGCARHVITVGSYNWNDELEHHGRTFVYSDIVRPGQLMTIGSLSGYSSPGPLRGGGVVKPEIAGPGQWYAAALPLNVAPRRAFPLDSPSVVARDVTGFYTLFNGTSAATPYVAGVVALIMEHQPDITLGQLRELLTTCASQDHHTDSVPNGHWGHGKVDEAALQRMLARLGRTAAAR